MKVLLTITFLFTAVEGWASVGFVNSASSGVASQTSAMATYSPTEGNTVIIYLSHNATTTGDSCKDNLSNTLTAGPKSSNTTNKISSFYYTVPSGVTSFTCTWTTARFAYLDVLEYSGVNSVNATLTGNTGSGSAPTYTMTVTTLVNNSWLAIGFGDAAATSWTSPTGNLRLSENSGTPAGARQADMDNTSAIAGAVTCAITGTGATAWNSVALELDPPAPAGGGGFNKTLRLNRYE